jgi:hypothetical protein
MTPAVVLQRVRRFLLVLSALLFMGTAFELWLVNHTEDAVQLIPFAMCGLGLAGVLLVLVRPRRAPLLALHVCMVLVVVGSLFGVYEHVAGNLAFHREIYPNAPMGELVMGAIAGANPLLAPGTLALAAMLALTATYRYSALGENEQST